MTIRSLLLAASVAALLAGCAKEDDSPQEGAGGTTTVPAGATGTMNVSLKYAIETRADQEYDDGEDSESKAQDLTIYFFDDNKNYLGSSYVSDLNQENETPENNNVTSTITVDVPTNIVQTLYDSSEAEAKIYVVAVLNKGTFTPQITVGESYSTFNAACQIALADAAKTDNFMMTSSNYIGNINGAEIEMALTPITEDHVGFKSDDQATDPITVTIAVERVVAKVMVQEKEDKSLDILGWGLNVTNKTFYPVKNFGGSQFLDELTSTGKYRDWIPYKQATWNVLADMRSHWAVDPNYSQDQATKDDDFNKFSFSDPSSAETGEALYCFENTTVETMQQRNATTSAVIVAQFYPKDFKETDKEHSWIKWNDLAYSGANTYAAFVEAVVKEADGDKQTITMYYKEDKDGDTEVGGKHYSSLSKDDFICIYTTDENKSIKFGDEIIGYEDAQLEVRLKEDINPYQIEGDAVTDASDAVKTAITKALTDNPPTVYYKGYCYYVVPIRHFAKDEVADYTGGEYQPHHLGRYGIVRNNYYQITINDITQPGEPITDPTVDPSTDKDDETNYWINVSIKVLSWKVRTQDVIL
ncbi:Mfa1 family fimbria major subunit [Bacteroides fragilis]|uniref:Mfa1 family fimbria major subunit n=1 Tax=Bacteroides fragilis TaxID=817 RepID=UPI0022AA0332|nr:Mfa1 family fimbria major subunit [Bacteroides fragilis]MCZ2501247.1 Mfa1 family fimbria major subunit [Bacteroides fragilis]